MRSQELTFSARRGIDFFYSLYIFVDVIIVFERILFRSVEDEFKTKYSTYLRKQIC